MSVPLRRTLMESLSKGYKALHQIHNRDPIQDHARPINETSALDIDNEAAQTESEHGTHAGLHRHYQGGRGIRTTQARTDEQVQIRKLEKATEQVEASFQRIYTPPCRAPRWLFDLGWSHSACQLDREAMSEKRKLETKSHSKKLCILLLTFSKATC